MRLRLHDEGEGETSSARLQMIAGVKEETRWGRHSFAERYA